ncbi:MAG: hypothetical protein HQL88_03245 [Magnetococcales bacterium]|nr:hypothetical protein [Magnetococcales bacterium]
MKNFIRGTLLGSVAGVALFWYGGITDYLPAIVVVTVFVGILIPLESQERQMLRIVARLDEIQRRLEQPVVDEPSFPPLRSATAKPEEPHTFIPTMQSDTAASTPSSHKKRTVDRSLEDVAKKLSSMQGG